MQTQKDLRNILQVFSKELHDLNRKFYLICGLKKAEVPHVYSSARSDYRPHVRREER